MPLPELKDLLLIVFGWLLGLLAPAFTATILERRETKILKAALFTELRELQCRLAMLIYRVESSYGRLDKKFLSWVRSILTGYDGIYSDKSLLEAMDSILNLDDEKIALMQKINQQKKPNSGLSIKKLYISLLNQDAAFLSKLDSILHSQLLEIRARIGFMNEITDDSQYYFRLSFEQGVSSRNYEIANTNMINEYKNYISQARDVIDIISKILAKK